MIKKILFLFLISFLFMTSVTGQKSNKKFVIKGVVTDAKQNPVEGAIIFIDKNQVNVITDSEGRYKVKVKPTAGVISVASSFGVKEMVIDGQNEINFVFSDSSITNLGEVKDGMKGETVNVGYGTQKKKDTGMPVTQLDGQKSKYASYSDIYSMIKGEFSGVTVRGTSITMRGSNSVNTSSEALLIVDGIKVSSIENIAPQMVKSIEVLKGPAAAIYGTRGTNGVILITLIR